MTDIITVTIKPHLHPLQMFPQAFTGGGDLSYYQGPPGPPGAFVTQPGYQGYHSGTPGASYQWDGPKPYVEPPKHTGRSKVT